MKGRLIMDNSKKIRKLIQRFFDGETTLAEERLLYDFFASDNVPDELAEYKEMFAGYAAIWQAEEVKTEVCGMADGNGSKAGYKTSVIKRLAISIFAAAAIMTGFIFINSRIEEQRFMEKYEGSYMIVNGQRIDNLSEIRNEIEQLMAQADEIERMADLQGNMKEIEETILSGIEDEGQRVMLKKLME